MTKKDYIAIASAIRTATTKYDVAMNLVSILKLDNPQFKTEKFLNACGYE